MKIETQIKKAGFSVEFLNYYQMRVNGEIDIWLNEKGRSLAWHDILLNERGRIPDDQIVFFLKNRTEMRGAPISKDAFIDSLVTNCGWPYQEAEQEWNKRQERTT